MPKRSDGPRPPCADEPGEKRAKPGADAGVCTPRKKRYRDGEPQEQPKEKRQAVDPYKFFKSARTVFNGRTMACMQIVDTRFFNQSPEDMIPSEPEVMRGGKAVLVSTTINGEVDEKFVAPSQALARWNNLNRR